MRTLFTAAVLLCLASSALAVPHSVRKSRRGGSYEYGGPGNGMIYVPDGAQMVVPILPRQNAPQYGQQGASGWNQQYIPNVPRPYYQTLPGWSVMPSLPNAPNYGAGNGW